MENKLEIVFLDAYTTNPGDLSWAPIEEQGRLIIHEHSSNDQFQSRAKTADILITNKFVLSKSHIDQCPNLKLICIAATGKNNVDMDTAADRNIPVLNVVNYSTDSVCQQVFALLLNLFNQVEKHNQSVKEGDWVASRDFSYTLNPIENLVGKHFGVIGFGNTGRAVAKVANAFGMHVMALNKYPEKDPLPFVQNVTLKELLTKSDVVSLHVPLNESTDKLINEQNLSLMKSSAILINTGRGGLVDETALYVALKSNQIAGAGLDVLTHEPPHTHSPLFDLENCVITPHVAWAGKGSRENLIKGIASNIEDWKRGKKKAN